MDTSTTTSSSTTTTANTTNTTTAEFESLRRLSDNLASSFLSPDLSFCADALLSLPHHPSPPLPLHRCILSSRSPFFRNLFSSKLDAVPPVKLHISELAGDWTVGYAALVNVIGYLYSGRVGELPRGECCCVDEECAHEACRPVVEFVVEVLYAAFIFEIGELVSLFQRHLLDILDKVANDDMPMVLYVANLCNKSCTKLINRCIEIVVNSDLDMITLEKTLPPDIVDQIKHARLSLGLVTQENMGFPEKHIRRILRALDSDDVELVRMLLKEGNTTLDDAHALHYAVAHCDSKITMELLDLALADVNHRNSRGYTVLHIAAMRKEPKIIVSLLTKGARPSDLTPDGRKALQISKRLAKHGDYHKSTEEGKNAPNDRLCIEILEQAERGAFQLSEASVSLAMAGDDLRGRLLYLENRVALARMLFPVEARVAMDIAQVDGTLEFTLSPTPNNSAGNQTTPMDLNDTPFKMKEEHLARMRALSRTVELGKRFFPRCSEVLNKIMDSEELSCLGRDTSDEKRRRYLELQVVLSKAFDEDKEEFDRSTLSSSSSSTSVGVVRTRK